MKTHKKGVVLAASMAVSVALVGASACSIIVPLLDDNGMDSVAGNYSFDVSLYNADFASNIYGDDYTPLIANQGLAMGIDLSLGSDDTYALTKWVESGTALDESDTTWSFYYEFTYYGSYSNSGSTVTLGQVESIAYQATQSAINAALGLVDVEYTETTDLESDAQYCLPLAGRPYTVIELWYGPYTIATGKGNVSQTIYLGSYTWATLLLPMTA